MIELGTLFKEAESQVQEALEAIQLRAEPIISGLDDRIEALCHNVMAVPEADRVQYVERLSVLLSSLNELGLALKQSLDIRDMTKHRSANVAYKVADSRDNFGKRDDNGDH